jgi:hypothetical protein
MLPEGFRWYPHLVGGKDFGDVSLKLGGAQGFEVALVNSRVRNGGWLSTVRRWSDRRLYAVSRSKERAMYWAERWATANEEAIWRAMRERERRHGLAAYRPERVVDR